MGIGKYLLLFSSLASFLYVGNGCQMDGVGTWLLTQDEEILDTYRGTFWNRTTSNIEALTGITVGGSVNYALYLDVQWSEGYFTISTSPGYEQYEENETSEFISFTVNFLCTGGSSNSLIFSIRIQDTNNNPPTFRPTDQYEFTITPPLPPGFQITGCVGDDIVVRDIDLTTSSINFAIEDNPYFEISYEGRSSTDPKEFLASLKTKDLIRSLSEDVELTISATDVDATQDPRITTYATIRVRADEEFTFPEELVFAQPFYTASYTNNLVVLEQFISLQQGYDAEVTFSLDGEHSDYFELLSDGNVISIGVSTALSSEILRSGRVILVIRAEREYTSGATTTVIIQLPEVLGLEFEQPLYEGRIVDNVMDSLQLTLSQGYQETFVISLQNEYASYFSTSVQENVVTLTMPVPLDASIINENSFITLQVIASNENGAATAVVTIDVIKDDTMTPVFDKAIYTGQYDPDTGLGVEQITLGQGYDQTVSFSLDGEHSEYFTITNVGPVISLASSGIPSEIWVEQQLLLTIGATKPRTVTATTTVSIRLPTARQLAFEASTYIGTLQENTLTLGTITLSEGYAEDIEFALVGDYASYFNILPAENEVTISLSAALPDGVISENNFLTLTLTASGLHAIPSSTAILLEIVKQDLTTPAFTENIYTGSYLGANSIEIGNISLAQGYDDSVTFRLDGEHAQYFALTNAANVLSLGLVSNIPPEVIFEEKVLLFNILAEKPLTVGANTAVSITFPQELSDRTVMRFSQNTYSGSLEDSNLALENIVLDTGYDVGTEFSLSGEYATYFQLQNTDNIVSISIQNLLPNEILENNKLVILEVEASRERAVSVAASIVIDIIRDDVVPVVFSNAYYKSVYADGNLENLTITLSEGFDDTVTFELQGDNSAWFLIINEENTVQVSLNPTIGIPDEVLENNDYFLFSIIANKLNTVSARTAVFIHLPKETPETVLVRFSQTSYVGRIDNGELYAPAITLLGEREPIYFNITGDYAEYFDVTQVSASNVEIQLKDSLPENIAELSFIVIDIEAQYPEAISGHTSVIFEVVKQPEIVTPLFEQAYYIGEYSEQGGLQFDQSIRLSQGFDESVMFTLSGDDAEWFELNNVAENSLTLVLSNNSLSQIRDRNYLVFSVVANKANGVAGYAAIIINLTDGTPTVSLRFAQDFYMGTIENNILNISSINIAETYSSDVNITLTGDHIEYFQLTNQESIITLQLVSDLPLNIISDNNVLVFTLGAQIEDVRTHTTIVLELIKTELTPLAFEETYYVGSYSIIDGFIFDPQITLSEGYDETVLFSLEGDSSQYFMPVIESENSVTLNLTSAIPPAVVMNNHHLIFTIRADKPESTTDTATVVIALLDDYTENLELLGFDRLTYIGSLGNNSLSLDQVILSEGYSDDVSFRLLGDFESYFNIISDGATVTITLNIPIPEQLIPENRIVILELEASATGAISAHAAIVIEVLQDDFSSVLEPLVFSDLYYTGHYTEADGLRFEDTITLTEGYDENVVFVLEGDSSQYFGMVTTNNSVSLSLATSIPSAVVMNNHHLIFTIRADKPDSITGRATIVIALSDEFTENMELLGFDRIAYIGSLENNSLSLDQIVLREGYSEAVSFRLLGELESYFNLVSDGAMITITLSNAIPEQLVPDNGIIILELEAIATGAISAHAAIIIEVRQDDFSSVLEQLVFSELHYTGHYTESDGLRFEDTITLTEGYDEIVVFILEGDSSQYFGMVTTNNSVSLSLTTPIPSAVLMNNHNLIFNIRADKPVAIAGRATIVIALSDEFTENMELLGFDRITYIGSLENSSLSLDQIVLREGYSEAVSFRLLGELESYFNLVSDGAMITITLSNAIPEQLVPDNRIIILELEAIATGAISAHAAIVIEVRQDDFSSVLEQLVFSELHFTGHYTESDGLRFEDTITLTEGYDENVVFVLEGDSSQYFGMVTTNNSVSLSLATSIPSAVVMNNHHLIFTIRADKPDSITGRATIVIALSDEFNENMELLGFDRITYIGSLENNSLSLDQIVLREGYSEAVSFRLLGELESYFNFVSDGAMITITLSNVIPEQLVPDNRIIILELEAIATGAMSAHAAIIIAVRQDDFNSVLEQLVFNELYYTGHYTESDGLRFEDTITLTEGYDENVVFVLEGNVSQYFGMVTTNNSVSLSLRTPIPSAVVMNNHNLIFTIRADKPDSLAGRATIVIALSDEFTENMEILGFDRITYIGSIKNNTLSLDQIVLSEGYSEAVSFRLLGDLQSYFNLVSDGATVTVSLTNPIPELSVPENRIIILELEASALGALSSHAVIIIEVLQDDLVSVLEQLAFSEAYYTGFYTEVDGLTFTDTIVLVEGFDQTVAFVLEGDSSQYFELVATLTNSVSLNLVTPIPSAIVMNNHQLIFNIRAEKPNAILARATIVISLLNEYDANTSLLGFDRINYVGSLEQSIVNLAPITLTEGYTDAVTFRLLGDLNSHFNLTSSGPSIIISLNSEIPEDIMPENRIIILELEAAAPNSLNAHATLIIEVVHTENSSLGQLVFNEAYYTGIYTEVDGLIFEDYITLTEDYDDGVTFVLEGDGAEYFEVFMVTDNSVTLRLTSSIPSAIVVNNRHLIFTINANRSNYSPARATIIIYLRDEYTEITPVLGFNRISYVGVIENNSINLELIVLTEGYSNNVNFALLGDLQDYFTLTRNEASLTISLLSVIPTELIPSNNIVILEIRASAPDSVSAHATIVLEVVQEDVEEIIFSDLYYTGHYSLEEGLVFNATVTLSHGYDDTIKFSLEGDDAEWFELAVSQNSVSILLINSIPENVLESQRKLIFVIVAQKAGISTRAAIIISLIHEAACSDAWFGKILYEGIVQGSEVQHEAISISGYDGTDIQLIGDFAALFSATLSEGVVVVQGAGSESLSPDVAYVALELSAASASAVLLLDVSHTENPEVPSVTFSSSSYSFRADVSQTGLVGLVHATANNLEAVTYSLEIEDTHLLQRISINNEGELYLWAPANGGVYSFQVRATTAFSQVSSTAAIHFTVEAITICGNDDYVLPPLQILDRDEESPYESLVPFNSSEFEGCRYSLSNRWPADQTWLYVDERGLHANAIDREHDSIAFMALSQIQVELILQCDSDNESTRTKRSVNAGLKTNLEHLGPYDYGNGKWILTDSILYNPRRTLVNLIVNDINDNYPIFNVKADEPIVVGYPVPDLEEIILPRALAEVQATDADVGENAELVYWSSEDTLAVSPATGLIHVRDIAGLENNVLLTVYATDRNGQGLTGSLDLLVKLVDTSHIAVVTIKDAFLDDEQDILNNLTTAVGYEVKSLRSSIISDIESEEVGLRKEREAIVSPGASLQIYVYGLIERDPVSVERLTGDINTSEIETVIIASMVSLEDHLENLVICPLPGRDTALFVSTIVLAVLLFILIVAAAVWFILKWRKNKNYEEFSDENSLASQNEAVPPVNIPKPEQPTPRINIEDLKKSERRLQHMLDAPLEVDIPTQPIPVQQASVKPVESKVNILDLPLVIQSFDKLKDADVSDEEDEFGERKKTRRKSVVTFNENVEKIIHVEDSPDDEAQDYEVYRL